MKWLVIAPNEKTEGVGKIIDFLQEKHTDAHFCRFDPSLKQIDFSKHKSQSFEELRTTLFEVSHCILLESHKIVDSSATAYLFGVLTGRGIPIFLTGDVDENKSSVLFSGMQRFPSVASLIEEIDRRYEEYTKEEMKAGARGKLYKKGLPFTPDCFSFQIAQGSEGECKLFLDAGMSPDVCDSAGTPMLCVAARSDKPDMVSLLMERGADINAVSKDRGYSPLMDAVWRNNTKLVEQIVGYKPDLNLVSNDGQTPLVLAVGNGNAEICEVLAANGANPEMQDHMGMTAFGYAKLFKKEDIVKILEPYEKKE